MYLRMHSSKVKQTDANKNRHSFFRMAVISNYSILEGRSLLIFPRLEETNPAIDSR